MEEVYQGTNEHIKEIRNYVQIELNKFLDINIYFKDKGEKYDLP